MQQKIEFLRWAIAKFKTPQIEKVIHDFLEGPGTDQWEENWDQFDSLLS